MMNPLEICFQIQLAPLQLGWADQAAHYPLSYEFSLGGGGATAAAAPLGPAQSSNVLDVLLPQGTHVVSIRVADAYGAAAATATTTVTVAPPTTTTTRRSLLQIQSAPARALPDSSRTLPDSGRSLLESSPSRSLLQSVVPATDYAELSAAQVLIGGSPARGRARARWAEAGHGGAG
jgi:hypothetical protein